MDRLFDLVAPIVDNLPDNTLLSIFILLLFLSFIFIYASLSPSKTQIEIAKAKQEKKMEKRKKESIGDRVTDGTMASTLMSLSFKPPYVWFIDPEEQSKEAVKITEEIANAQLYHALNYRSFIVIRVIFAFSGLLILAVLVLIATFADILFPAFVSSEMTINIKLISLFIGGVISIFPSFWLSGKAKKTKSSRAKDLPILQLFLILSLRTGRSTKEVFNTLGYLNTQYSQIFKTAFLMYLRSPTDAFSFLREEFEHTQFEHTIKALSNMSEYSKEDTILLLEHALDEIVVGGKEKQEKRNIVNLLITQASLFLPLVALGLLVIYPIIIHVAGMIGGQVF